MTNTLRQVFRVLASNRARTLLTTLGIVIGISMVILVLAAGEGFRSFIVSQVEAFGTNTIFIETRVPPTTRARNDGQTGQGLQNSSANQAVAITTLKTRDVEDIKRLANVQNAYGAVIGLKVVSYKDVKKNSFIFAADSERFNVDAGQLVAGRFYTPQEDIGASQVVILGNQAAADLFGQEDAVGKTLRIDQYNFTVIGVYERRGGLDNSDQYVFVPLNTAQKKLMGINYIFYAVAQVRDQDLAEATAEDIRILLRDNHDISDPVKDDFFVQTQAQGLSTFQTILSGISFLLVAIATISLIVGGVGIMNIMYVVVTERTAEIGLKKALGAKNKDILLEFLLEALVITLVGGFFGIILGSLLAFVVAQIANSYNFAWEFTVPLVSIVLGMGVSAAIGIVFGVFPARRASKLDPIEALRHE